MFHRSQPVHNTLLRLNNDLIVFAACFVSLLEVIFLGFLWVQDGPFGSGPIFGSFLFFFVFIVDGNLKSDDIGNRSVFELIDKSSEFGFCHWVHWLFL